MKIASCLFIAIICLHASPLRAAAVVAVSNTGQPPGTSITVGRNAGLDFQQAISFTTGPIASELSHVTVAGNSLDNLTGFTVVVCTGLTSAGPTGIVTTLDGNYAPPSSVILAANSTYWIVVSAPNTDVGTAFLWTTTTSRAEDTGGLPGWTIGDVRWGSSNGGAGWGSLTDVVPQIAVRVNVLPETAPAITVQPSPQSVISGSNVTLSVTATGNPAPTFQWRKDGADIPGATRSSLNLNPASPSDAGAYAVVVSNSAGSVTSRTVTVDVTAAPIAVSNVGKPFAINQTVGKGSGFDFQQAISFTTGASISELISVALSGFGYGSVSGFSVSLYRGIGASGPTGLIATLTGNARPTTLSNYSYGPAAPLGLAPNSTYWIVASASTTSLNSGFSWQSTASLEEDPGGLPGWAIGNTRWLSNNAGTTWQAVGGAVPLFTLQVTVAPATALSIATPPASQTAVAGSNVTLSVSASGNPVPSYQWRKDGVAIPGATSSSLTLNSVSRNSVGSYSVVVSNSAGSVTSAAAVVEVIPASWLSNLSVRNALAPGQVLTVGAVVSGGEKTILVRAAGPVLNSFNLVGVVDPRLDLFTSGAEATATNEDWPAALAATFASVGAFPFPTASKDAALAQALNGAFTIQASGPGAGTVLVEAYDVAGGASSRLINLSVRTRLGTAAGDTLIVGISLSGTGSKQVLIRAVGPGLIPFGVESPLADPRLQVLNSAGAVVATNDNWGANLSTTFAQVAAFPLPANSRDAALVASLAAGASYTVQISGVNSGTNEVLVEVYEIF